MAVDIEPLIWSLGPVGACSVGPTLSPAVRRRSAPSTLVKEASLHGQGLETLGGRRRVYRQPQGRYSDVTGGPHVRCPVPRAPRGTKSRKVCEGQVVEVGSSGSGLHHAYTVADTIRGERGRITGLRRLDGQTLEGQLSASLRLPSNLHPQDRRWSRAALSFHMGPGAAPERHFPEGPKLQIRASSARERGLLAAHL